MFFKNSLSKFGHRTLLARSADLLLHQQNADARRAAHCCVVLCPQFAVPKNKVLQQQQRSVMHQPFTKKTVEERILLTLNLYDKVDNDKITMDSDFFKDLGLDSLDFVEIILALEEEFAFEIPDGDADRMRTPRDIFQYICDKNDVFH